MRKYMDIISGNLFLLLAVLLYVYSYGIRTFSDTAFGVTFMPRLTAMLMAIIAMVVIYNGLAKLRKAPEPGGIPVSRGLILTIILIFFYILFLNRLGFILNTFAYIVAQAYILSNFEKQRLWLWAIIAAVFSTSIYFLFTRVIYIMLPAGILG